MRRWNMILLIGVLAVTISCTPQIEITPTSTLTPTAPAILSREEAARQLTQGVTQNLRRLNQLNALCDNVLNGGINAYHEAIRDTFTELLSRPESRQFDLKDLQTIFTEGIAQSSDFLPSTAQPNLTVAPKLMGRTVEGREVILATWGNAPCQPSGHVHYTTALYVFDTTGQVLFEGGSEEVTAYPAINGWLVMASQEGPLNELWHIHSLNGRWSKEALFQGNITNLSVKEDAHKLQIQYDSVSYTPPCQFQPERAAAFDHALLSGGEKVWGWRDNAYVLESDRFQKAEVYLWPDGEMLQVLEDWQKYCVD